MIKLTRDDNMDWRNYDRLYRWMHIGEDIPNGIYAIQGARLAYKMLTVTKWDGTHNVKHFNFLNDLFEQTLNLEYDTTGILLGTESSTYRNTISGPMRSPVNYTPEYDIVFIHNNESGAEENFNRVKERFPRAKELAGIKGIHNAHIEASKLCSTDYFWVVDGDAIIHDDFNFDYAGVSFYEQPTVRVFRAINPVNNLVYGHGGVKLLPRLATLRMNTDNIDMTTSISKLYEPVNIVSNIHKFNTDEFSAWRTAFRECVKLSSQVIDRQQSSETLTRLYTWCSTGSEEQYGKETIRGALMGKLYGDINKDNQENLQLINNYEWLKTRMSRMI